MRLGDTIIAAASGPGRSVRALVRVSGPAVPMLLSATVGPAGARPGARGAVMTLASGANLPLLLAVFAGPRSYTGEDVAELTIPGNPALVERVIARLVDTGRGGVRPAGPGEFTARAYFNGRLSLEQAEGVGAVIAAATDEELAGARAVLEGRAGDRFRNWSERTVRLLALVEAGIDFTDQEDVVAIAPARLREEAGALWHEIEEYLGGGAADEEHTESPLVVLAGEPNAGKSTLFNALLGRRRAVVSDEAGTTRDALVETLDLSSEVPGAGAVRVADLPGIEQGAHGRSEFAAQAAAGEAIRRADVLIQCDPHGRFANLPGVRDGTAILRVRTKADLPWAGPEGPATVAVCALDGWHLGALRRAVADAAWGSRPGKRGAVVARHRRALTVAAGALAEVARAGRGPEVSAESLRHAVESLGELTGRVMPDDVLGRIFASFCVGK